MNNAEKINLVEKNLKRAYCGSDAVPVIADSWRHDVMGAIYSENSNDNLCIELTTARIWHFSWVAAGIAACYMLVFSLFYNTDNLGIENDFQNFYVDSSVAEFIPGESQ